MLKIEIPDVEVFNEKTCEFEYYKGATIILEHSLVSVAKWESEWHKPFLSKKQKTKKELRSYIKHMTITQNVDENLYKYLDNKTLERINNYINDPMTATTIHDSSNTNNGEATTNELIYYWMFSLNIPKECEKWHLNRLMTLIRVFNAKNAPNKKMSSNAVKAQNASLNAARRKAHRSRG